MLFLIAEAHCGVSAGELVATASGTVFISAGFAKLRNGGLLWLSGAALFQHTLIGDVLGEASGMFLCRLLAPLAVLVEVCAPILLLGGKRKRILFIALAVAFHFSQLLA